MDNVLNDMWDSNQCREYPYRSDHRQVSAWLNRAWYSMGARRGLAPWTWATRDRGMFE
jgi:hypothetical protein